MFDIQWRANEGYGDFITGLCYAHSSTIKYEREVSITFHWPNEKDYLFSEKDKETIFFRFQTIKQYLKKVDTLTINHKFNSRPNFRFINELEEFNPLHGLWYLEKQFETEPGLVALWTSEHNIEFPGLSKDPLHKQWHLVKEHLQKLGYKIFEITYRTPIKQVMEIITRCEFGIGYEGMIHQLFKFLWKPTIIAAKRFSLTNLLIPQATIIDSIDSYFKKHIFQHIEDSYKNIEILQYKHRKYLLDTKDPTKHPLYNQLII